MYKNIISCIISLILLGACGAGNTGIKFTPTPGVCADGKLNAPYCMSITVINNESGQNLITSVAPIANIRMTINGANNLLNPFTDPSKLDPNNCFESTIVPGESCVFYLQLNNESYPAGNIADINLQFSYKLLNKLFNNDNNESNFSYENIKEVSNIYIVLGDNARSIWRINDLNHNNPQLKQAESLATGSIVSSFLDNNKYGYLDISTTTSMFQFSMLFDNLAGNLLSFPAGGANNLISNGNTLYISGANKSGVWQIDLSNPIWNESSPTYNTAGVIFNDNSGIVSPISNTLYFAMKDKVYTCAINNDNENPSCILTFANVSNDINNTINKLAFLPIKSSLIAGTTQGIYYLESKANYNTHWLATSVDNEEITSSANDINSDTILFGSNMGNIWLIDSDNMNNPIKFYSNPSQNPISSMTIDKASHKLLFTTNSNTNINLYSCLIVNKSPCSDVEKIASIPSLAKVIGIHIGSELATKDLSNE